MAGKKAENSIKALREFAMRYPEADEGTSCNKAAFRARKKAYLYIGSKADAWNVMLKVKDSKADVEQLAGEKPDQYSVNAAGWVTARFGKNEAAPKRRFTKWIDESYRLIVPRKLVATLPEKGPPDRGGAHTR